MIVNDWFEVHCVMSYNLFSTAGKILVTFNRLTLETRNHPEGQLVRSVESGSSTSSQSCQVLNFLTFLLPQEFDKNIFCGDMKENDYPKLRHDFFPGLWHLPLHL